jgi:mannitol/fructose-specific phosphotransferase system IIA component (Ntr-type)
LWKVIVLKKLLTPQTIRLNVTAKDWQEVTDIAGQLLLDSGAVAVHYIQAMKDTIHSLGPYVVIAPGIALLHARPADDVNRICMSLVTLNPPVAFGHKHNDPVTIAIALGGVDENSHMDALAQIADILSDEEKVNCIRQAQSVEDILSLL